MYANGEYQILRVDLHITELLKGSGLMKKYKDIYSCLLQLKVGLAHEMYISAGESGPVVCGSNSRI